VIVRSVARLLLDRQGAAAAEMALVTPMLIILMFGAMELGKYFLDEHVVVKSVREGARYAARQSLTKLSCTGGTPTVDATVEGQIKNVVRTGIPDPVNDTTDPPRVWYWPTFASNAGTVTVTLTCYDNSGGGSTTVYNGVYQDMTNFPRVTVTAAVPYTPLLGSIGFSATGLHLRSTEQAAVMGI
jgi:Flp pilus assembly protein TadG